MVLLIACVNVLDALHAAVIIEQSPSIVEVPDNEPVTVKLTFSSETPTTSFAKFCDDIRINTADVYRDDTLVDEYSAEGELLGFIIVAFNEEGQPMTATVDNVKVLRTQVQ